MKINVAVREALRKNERQGETQFITEIHEFPAPSPPLFNINVFFFCFFFLQGFLLISPYL